MKFKLTGKDFQSWRRFDLTVNGFTIVVGSSNRGKTAIIRALRGILRNQASAAFIRHGQKETELELSVEKGPTATLTRGKTTTYKVNGEDFAKLAGDVPLPIQDLRLHEIPIGSGSTKLDPTFAGQFDSQFMMDLSPADLNAVFGLFSNTEQLNQGKKTINQNNTEINAQAKILATDIQNGHIKLAAIEKILARFDALRPEHDKASQQILTIETVQSLIARRARLLEGIRQRRSVAEMALPSTETLQETLRLGRGVRQAQRLRQYVLVARRAIQPVDAEKWATLARNLARLEQYVALKSRFRAMPPLPALSTTAVTTADDLFESVNAWLRGRVSVEAKSEAARKMADELTDLHEQLHELTKDTTECPKCGYQFVKE